LLSVSIANIILALYVFIDMHAEIITKVNYICILIGTVFNYGVRMGWDSLLFYSLIKPKGRLPSGNSWIVKRTMGPGLAPDFYFEVNLTI